MRYIIPFALLLQVIALRVQGQGLVFTPQAKYDTLRAASLIVGASSSGDAGVIKEAYTIPRKYFPEAISQGTQESCAGFAVGYAITSFYQAVKKKWNIDSDDKRFSPTYLYQQIKTCGDCDRCGASIDDALDSLKHQGNVRIMQFDNSKCAIPNDKNLLVIAKDFRIKNWTTTADKRCQNTDELKSLLRNNRPVILGMMIPNAKKYKYNFSSIGKRPENYTYKWNANAREIYPGHINDRDSVGHAVVLVGFDDNRDAFKILNSYGKDWGTDGYLWINYNSFRAMVRQGFIVTKDYENPAAPQMLELATLTPRMIVGGGTYDKQDYRNAISFFGRKEFVKKGRYYFSYGLTTSDVIKSRIKSVDYIFDHPTFANKVSNTTAKSNFISSYEGWGCLSVVKANVYFDNNDSLSYQFDGCGIINNPLMKPTDDNLASLNIQPIISAKYLAKNSYDFSVSLRGIQPIKEQVDKVEYDWNHSTFRNPVTTTMDSANNFQSGYRGWGCLNHLKIIIFFKNGQQKELVVNMCEELGW